MNGLIALSCARCGQQEQIQRILFPSLGMMEILRHGRTGMNDRKIIIGSIDDSLNEIGLNQAKVVAEQLMRKSQKYERVLCSDLKRAWQTAIIIGQELDIKVEIDRRLRERCVGEYEGQAEFPKMLQRFIGEELLSPSAETLTQFERRISQWLEEVSSPPQMWTSFIVVTHALTLLMTMKKIRGWDLNHLLQYQVPLNCVPVTFYFNEPCSNCYGVFYEKSESG